MEPRILNILQRVGAEKDEARKAELKAETNDELAAHFYRNAQDLEELAFDLFNLAFSDVMKGDFAGRLVDTETVGLTETSWIEEDLRGMRAYFQGKGGQIRSDILRYERTQMPREELVSAIDLHLDEIQTDFWGMLTKLQGQVRQKMESAPVEKLVELIQFGLQSGSTFGSFAAATLSSAQLDPILDAVALRGGGQATILGTGVAIRKLSNIGLAFGQNIQEQIFRTGIIGVYKGYPVAQLENWEDFQGKFVLPNNELYIVGRKAGKITYYGAQAKVQQLQLPSFYRRWETARDVGISVHGIPKGRVGRVILT
jgi:hypothetical protein